MDKNILIKKIALEGKKISDLELTEYISGEELIEITQDQKSKAVSIDTILESANTGVIKIPRRDITLDKAISLVKDSQKSFGAILHFHNGETDSWEMYRYNNPSIKDFDDTSNWEYINISNNFKGLFPTEKDLLARFPRPSLNDYALVGTTMESADTYYAAAPNTWSKTTNKLNNKLCKYKGITSRDANIKVVCTPTPASKSCSRPYRRGNSVYWRLDDGTEEWLFDVTDDINLICPETPDEEVYDVFVRTTEGGTFTPQPVITPVPFNTTINLTAIPEEGYEFKYWQVGDTKHTTSELTVNVTDDVVILGVFEKKEVPLPPTPTPPPTPQPKPKYTIKSRAVNGGITVPSSITVEEGTEVEIGAFVPENKLFKHWTLNNQIVGTTNTIKVIADSNKEYVAIIEDKPVTPKPDPVPELPKPEPPRPEPEQPTPPTPKPTPTPVITYDIEADTTPVSITIDDTTQEREVCFSYKVVKNTTLEGNTTKEYVSNYTSNRAKDRFCVTTSTNQQLPLEVTVEGVFMSRNFTINVTDNRTPDKGFFEIDYPNSTGIEETPEGPKLVNQCYTDGSGGEVTYVIKLTERSNPFTTIPTLPQGIEVTLSEDKKTMTIKTICNLISTITGKIFEVFDLFRRKISVWLSPVQEKPQPVPVIYRVQVVHEGDIDHPYTDAYDNIEEGFMFKPQPDFIDSHTVEIFKIGVNTVTYDPNVNYRINSNTTFTFRYKRKVSVDPIPPTNNTIPVRVTYSFNDITNSTQPKDINFSKPEDTIYIDQLGEYKEFTAPDIPGYAYVSSVVEGQDTSHTEKTFSTMVTYDVHIVFNYTKLDTDSYGKPLPFKFKPSIIDYVRFSTPVLADDSSVGMGAYDYISTIRQKNDFALRIGNKQLDKSWFPITVSDGTTTRTYTATAEREYKNNAADIWGDNPTFDVDTFDTANILVRENDQNIFYISHYKGWLDRTDNNRIGGYYTNTLTDIRENNYILGEDYSEFTREKLFNRSKRLNLLPYPKKEITVTIKGEEYRFKEDIINTIRVVAYSGLKGDYNLMLFPWTTEGHPTGYTDGLTDATVIPLSELSDKTVNNYMLNVTVSPKEFNTEEFKIANINGYTGQWYEKNTAATLRWTDKHQNYTLKRWVITKVSGDEPITSHEVTINMDKNKSVLLELQVRDNNNSNTDRGTESVEPSERPTRFPQSDTVRNYFGLGEDPFTQSKEENNLVLTPRYTYTSFQDKSVKNLTLKVHDSLAYNIAGSSAKVLSTIGSTLVPWKNTLGTVGNKIPYSKITMPPSILILEGEVTLNNNTKVQLHDVITVDEGIKGSVETVQPIPIKEFDVVELHKIVMVSDSGDGIGGSRSFNIFYNGNTNTLKSLRYEIPSIGVNSGELTNIDEGFSYAIPKAVSTQAGTINVRVLAKDIHNSLYDTEVTLKYVPQEYSYTWNY